MSTRYDDCLGCLMDALQSGEIDEKMYETIFEQWAELATMKKERCPRCQEQAVLSMYDPELMHCPACGCYSRRTADGTWQPFRQGRKSKAC